MRTVEEGACILQANVFGPLNPRPSAHVRHLGQCISSLIRAMAWRACGATDSGKEELVRAQADAKLTRSNCNLQGLVAMAAIHDTQYLVNMCLWE
jgi:hypothetical protein